MTQLKMIVTSGGKHPASKWAELAADEIIHVSSQAPDALVREAQDFRARLVKEFTRHHQAMMDHEQAEIKAGRHDLSLPYQTEDYAKEVRESICGTLAKGTNFADHFQKQNVQEWVEGICNKYFKSAKMVERQHFHSEKAAAPINKKKKS